MIEETDDGYVQCDACGVEPIVGVRYKCTVCDISEEVDLCSKCMAVGTFRNGKLAGSLGKTREDDLCVIFRSSHA